MAEFPALPFWTDAYLADTSHLTDLEHGRYLLVLIHLWRMPQMRFPNEDAWLARKFGRSVQAFETEIKPIMREFLRCDGNWWTSKRLLLEWEYLKKRSYQRSGAAKSRWEKQKDICGKDAGPHEFRNAPTPTPTPTPITPSGLARKVARGTRWEATAAVPDEWIVDAGAMRTSHKLPEIDLGLEAETFANFWSSKTGFNATKLDWRRTWINWALKAEGKRNGNGKTTAHDKFFNAAASLIREQLSGDGPAIASDGDGDAQPSGRPLLPP